MAAAKYLAALLAYGGANAAYRKATAADRKPVVLAYHRVPDGGEFRDETQDYVSAPAFEKQIEYAARRRAAVTFGELVARGGEGGLLAVTFDDGYGDNLRVARPILAELGIPATLFVTTDAVAGRGWLWWDLLAAALHNAIGKAVTFRGRALALTNRAAANEAQAVVAAAVKRSPDRDAEVADVARQVGFSAAAPPGLYLDWDQVNTLREEGWEIGAHTKRHAVLTSLSPAAAREEIESSAAEIAERTGTRPRVFAYPNGRFQDFDDDVIRYIKDAGMISAATMVGGPVPLPLDPYRVNRVAPRGGESHATFRLRLTGLYDAIKGGN